MENKLNFSEKQEIILNCWKTESKYKDCNVIIVDGAIQGGKTFATSLSFLLWSMTKFYRSTFGICGKSLAAINRNIIKPMQQTLTPFGFSIRFIPEEYILIVQRGMDKNRYLLFTPESPRLYYGLNNDILCGALFDEVSLLNFYDVKEVMNRCANLHTTKFWFNSTSGDKNHWFYKYYINQIRDNWLYLTFYLSDNPSSSPNRIKNLKSAYKGIFYERFIEGKWKTVLEEELENK